LAYKYFVPFLIYPVYTGDRRCNRSARRLRR